MSILANRIVHQCQKSTTKIIKGFKAKESCKAENNGY